MNRRRTLELGFSAWNYYQCYIFLMPSEEQAEEETKESFEANPMFINGPRLSGRERGAEILYLPCEAGRNTELIILDERRKARK